jgi:hypothetical protein
MTTDLPPGLPPEPGVLQLRWMIERVAAGEAPVEALIAHFRQLHEKMEHSGRPHYRSKDEARLIWDMLWALEFYSPNPASEPNPAEWNDADAILAEVRRVNDHLRAL